MSNKNEFDYFSDEVLPMNEAWFNMEMNEMMVEADEDNFDDALAEYDDALAEYPEEIFYDELDEDEEYNFDTDYDDDDY